MAGSSVLVRNLFRSVQVSASYCAWRAGVTQFGSLASVGLAVGVVAAALGVVAAAAGVLVPVGVVDGVGAAARALGMARPAVDGVPEARELAVAPPVGEAVEVAVEPPLDVPVAVAVGVADAPAAPSWITGRKCSWAEVLTRFLVAWLGVPGRSTTMFLPPWEVTWASLMPVPLTRSRMMLIAWLMVPWETVPVVTGCSTISSPPSRSRPSLGVSVPVPWKWAAAMVP